MVHLRQRRALRQGPHEAGGVSGTHGGRHAPGDVDGNRRRSLRELPPPRVAGNPRLRRGNRRTRISRLHAAFVRLVCRRCTNRSCRHHPRRQPLARLYKESRFDRLECCAVEWIHRHHLRLLRECHLAVPRHQWRSRDLQRRKRRDPDIHCPDLLVRPGYIHVDPGRQARHSLLARRLSRHAHRRLRFQRLLGPHGSRDSANHPAHRRLRVRELHGHHRIDVPFRRPVDRLPSLLGRGDYIARPA